VLVLEEGGLPHDGVILTTTYVTIGLSVLAHGLTAAPLANRYADWYESHPRDALPASRAHKCGTFSPAAAEWQLPRALSSREKLLEEEGVPVGYA
jgi:NhaP-type Na+/H+ or K+/H+ antiporter